MDGFLWNRVGEKRSQIGGVSRDSDQGKCTPHEGKDFATDGAGMSVSPNLNQDCGEIRNTLNYRKVLIFLKWGPHGLPFPNVRNKA